MSEYDHFEGTQWTIPDHPEEGRRNVVYTLRIQGNLFLAVADDGLFCALEFIAGHPTAVWHAHDKPLYTPLKMVGPPAAVRPKGYVPDGCCPSCGEPMVLVGGILNGRLKCPDCEG